MTSETPTRDREVAHVALVKLELDARRARPVVGNGEHRRRGVDPDHAPLGPLRNRDRDAAGPDGELDDRPVRFAGKIDVEVDVVRHVG